MNTANRIQALKPSATLAVSARADELIASGEDIVNLSLGEPDFPTPAHICEAAIQAIHAGKTRYTAVDGTRELKQAIIHKFQKDNGLRYEANQILASCGAKHSLFNLFMAMLNPGDEVIIPAPYWVSYPDMVQLAEATPVIIRAGIEQHYKITPEQLDACITKNTKLLILNSPSNPTGACYSQAELKALADVLLKHPQVYIISDDIYEKIIWSAEPFTNIVMACPNLYERTIIVNGASKAYAMTGWRLGYAAGPAPLIAAAKKIQSQSTSNPCSISQAAMTAALNSDQQCVTQMTAAFKARYEFLAQGLATLPGFSLAPCEGAFYIFPNVAEAIARLPQVSNDLEFAELLLTEAKIACVPGSAFGQPDSVRFSYATNIATLEKALNRLEDLLRK